MGCCASSTVVREREIESPIDISDASTTDAEEPDDSVARQRKAKFDLYESEKLLQRRASLLMQSRLSSDDLLSLDDATVANATAELAERKAAKLKAEQENKWMVRIFSPSNLLIFW